MSSSGTRDRARARSLQRNIAIEAARLISEDGVRDYRRAARKASARLGIMDERAMPTARDIDDALREEATFRGYTIVDPATVLTTHLTEIAKDHMPEMRRLLRTLRRRSRGQLKLMTQVASATLPQR